MKTNELSILSAPYPADLSALGGKAGNLVRLHNMGLPVPAFVVIPQDALSHALPASGQPEQLRDLINEFVFPESWIARISELLPDAPYFAVRSSGLAEDGAEHSFAGQFRTELYVTPDNLLEAIRKVWLSAFDDRVLAYVRERGLEWKGNIAIIIQEMVPAEVAGVGFGLHPTEGWRDTSVISAVYGLGEGLVSGHLDGDTYVVRNGAVESMIADKNSGFYYSEATRQVENREVPISKRDLPALTTEQVLELDELVRHLNKSLGRPQDIEFAFAHGRLFLLQARPVTGLHLLPDKSAHRIVWDNSNIIESYPGVTTPLTFSFIIKMYEAVYRQMGSIMGVSEHLLDKNADVFANMLGLLRGRVYYNLEGWYRALAMLPGYKVNARFMETMMGVKERFDIEEEDSGGGLKAWVRLIWSVFKMIGLLLGLKAERGKFKQVLDQIIADYRKMDFDVMRPDESMRRYYFFEQFLLKKWKAPLVNDFFAMIYFGILKKSCAKIAPDNPSLHNDLLAGSHDIISTAPFRRIKQIAEEIHLDQDARSFFTSNSAELIWQEIHRFPKIRTMILDYLEHFGERTVGELKLETITYTQHPASFISILQSYARQASVPATVFDENALRRSAEETVNGAYRFSPLKKWFFYGLLKRTRSLVSSRENLRYERTRGFAVVRRIFNGIGVRFAAEGILESPRDIFYLTKEEIFDFIKGTSVMPDLKTLVSHRKDAYHEYEQEQPLPERIVTYGTVYHANDLRTYYTSASQASAAQDNDPDLLKGLGCSAGVVKGRVRVVRSPDEIESIEGDILVTSSTDPGWVALFPSASAILVERGSLLSHSAIVSRELGIPCVVGITGLLSRLKTGDWVEMNGTSGEIRIIHPQA